MQTFEQTLDRMQLDAGPLAALVFVPLHNAGNAFRVIEHKRRLEAERDEAHEAGNRWWPVEGEGA